MSLEDFTVYHASCRFPVEILEESRDEGVFIVEPTIAEKLQLPVFFGTQLAAAHFFWEKKAPKLAGLSYLVGFALLKGLQTWNTSLENRQIEVHKALRKEESHQDET